ncbi:hypothetical protein [Brevundimonas sp. SL130]|uniref:hypothetical protein n=1 Tax=Brevundimonas sp. SL130 TaxID=2995143 RepID=UPI00226C9366|nr:hypothetical protein [Brevundimonas sp. SL130]WAC60113.1 hypothetical protein OU998_01310 [Brevundimonas sp. SL130]
MNESIKLNIEGLRLLNEGEIEEVNGCTVAASAGLVLSLAAVYAVFRQIGYEAGKDQALRDNRADDK